MSKIFFGIKKNTDKDVKNEANKVKNILITNRKDDFSSSAKREKASEEKKSLTSNTSNEGKSDDSPALNISPENKVRIEVSKPSFYKVLMLNDDFTPMEFVIEILQKFFHMSDQEATNIMLQVHHKGFGICGVFTFEIAETKVVQVMNLAKECRYPLQCRIQKE